MTDARDSTETEAARRIRIHYSPECQAARAAMEAAVAILEALLAAHSKVETREQMWVRDDALDAAVEVHDAAYVKWSKIVWGEQPRHVVPR